MFFFVLTVEKFYEFLLSYMQKQILLFPSYLNSVLQARSARYLVGSQYVFVE